MKLITGKLKTSLSVFKGLVKMDNTKGTKTNRVKLNLAQVHGALEPPEPGVASVFVDDIPLHAVHYLQLTAGIGRPTLITLQFECDVVGKLGGKNIEEMIRETRGE